MNALNVTVARSTMLYVYDESPCQYGCVSGYWMNVHGVCTTCDACPDGQMILEACGGDHNTICTACAAIDNAHLLDAETCAFECVHGFWGTGGACMPCLNCGGNEVLQVCNATHNTVCSQCGVVNNGYTVNDTTCEYECLTNFWKHGGLCLPCLSTCPQGEVFLSQCTSGADAVCSDCGSLANGYVSSYEDCTFECYTGYYASDNGTCMLCTECGDEGYAQQCDSTQNAVCNSCPDVANGVVFDYTPCTYVCDNGFWWDGAACVQCTACDGDYALVSLCSAKY